MKHSSIRLSAVVTLLMLFSITSCRKQKDTSASMPESIYPANLHRLDLRLQKAIQFLQSSPQADAQLRLSLPPKALPNWSVSLIGQRGKTFVALVPFKTSTDRLFTGFLAIEADSLLRLRAFRDQPSSETLPFIDINHAINALNSKGLGHKIYNTHGLTTQDLTQLEKRRRPADDRIATDYQSISVTECYSWSTCMGDGQGNCVGTIYHFTECVTTTYWISDYTPGYPTDSKWFDGEAGGGYTDPGDGSGTPTMNPPPPPTGPITDVAKYLSCFTSQLPAKATIYVDQPTPGTTEPVSILGGIGHAFIAFEQQIGDQVIRRTIGFYPENKIDPFRRKSGSSILGRDENRNFDVKLEMSINGSQLERMLNAAKGYAEVYHIDSYNCVNFVLDVAGAGGIQLPRTTGWWYTGSGLNPGNLGEDLRKQPGADGKGGTSPGDTGNCQ